MSSFLRQTLRAATLLAVVTAMGTTLPASDKSATPAAESPTASRMMPEVRLRKLHLVRPDLIPYPIAYEVYC